MNRNIQKFIEQFSFSGIGFLGIFLAGYLLAPQDFFNFSYSFTIVQALALLYFSYISNSFFVFYSKSRAKPAIAAAARLLLLLHLVVLLPFIWLGRDAFTDIAIAILGWAVIFLWCALDIVRKVLFIQQSRALVLPSLLALLLFTLGILLCHSLGLLSPVAVFACLLAALLVPVAVFGRALLGRLSQQHFISYIKENHSFSIWSAYSAVATWWLLAGLLIYLQPLMTELQFNAARLLLSFIGLANLITTVIENNLIVQLSQQAIRLTTRWWLRFCGLCLGVFVLLYLASVIGFQLFYQQYLPAFYDNAGILLVTVFFMLNKPIIASLKVMNRTPLIFVSLLLASAVTLVFTGMSLSLAGLNVFVSAALAGAFATTLFLSVCFITSSRE